MRSRILATVALAAALSAAPLAAQAATPPTHNVLRGFCAATVETSCVSVMDNDEGVLQIRDAGGKRHTFRSAARAERYLARHATPCAQEDSPSCYWDAGHAGNGVGDSFIVVGKRSLFYLGNLR